MQRRPDLFPALCVLVDRKTSPARFLILGSASGNLLRQSSESLPGRFEHVAISGLSLRDPGANKENALWRRGGFPRAYLAASEKDSVAWHKSFISTLLERDLPQWGTAASVAGHHHRERLQLRRDVNLAQKTQTRCRIGNALKKKPGNIRGRCVRSSRAPHARH